MVLQVGSELDGDDLKHELEARARADDAAVARRASLMLGAITRSRSQPAGLNRDLKQSRPAYKNSAWLNRRGDGHVDPAQR